MNSQTALQAYTHVRHVAAVASADSHHLIHLLYQGGLERLAQARGAMQQGQWELKGQKIAAAVNIVGGLRDFLDLEQGGELAHNLSALYDYLQRLLWEAHRDNDTAKLEEAMSLLAELAGAWEQMGREMAAANPS